MWLIRILVCVCFPVLCYYVARGFFGKERLTLLLDAGAGEFGDPFDERDMTEKIF